MKTSKKVAIIVSVVAIIIGLFLCGGAAIAMDFKFSNISTENYVTNTYIVEDMFMRVTVEAKEYNVRLHVSEDGQCKVEYTEDEKVSCSVKVDDDTLAIQVIDTREWYEYISWSEIKLDIYLPQREYESLFIRSHNGDIAVPNDFTFMEADICSTSGEINFLAAVKNNLYLKTVNGDISVVGTNTNIHNIEVETTSSDIAIKSVTLEGALSIKTIRGNIDLNNITCQNVVAESTTGDMEFSDLIAKEMIRTRNYSGDVELWQCDAGSLDIKTTSGDVSGSLLTQKIFVTDTTSGDVDVPRSTSGGICQVNTTSGNIEFIMAES